VTSETVAQPLGLALRQDDPLSFMLMIKVMLITAVLLAVVYGVMRWYAQRHAGAGSTLAGPTDLQCVRALRLSTKTKVYLLKTETSQVLVTESSNGAIVTLLPEQPSSSALDARS
jgi:flagellar biogenesis protein FliO